MKVNYEHNLNVARERLDAAQEIFETATDYEEALRCVSMIVAASKNLLAVVGELRREVEAMRQAENERLALAAVNKQNE